jgi:hypothetical protein
MLNLKHFWQNRVLYFTSTRHFPCQVLNLPVFLGVAGGRGIHGSSELGWIVLGFPSRENGLQIEIGSMGYT